jgi:uncharacterized lipoprotein
MDLFKKSGTMNTTLKYSFVVFFLSTLTGCNTVSTVFGEQHVVYNREYDYLQTTSAPPLAVPPGVDGTQLGNNYVIPGTQYPQHLQKTSMVPPGSMEDLVARGQLPASIVKSNVIPTAPLPSANNEMSAATYETQSASITPELTSTTVQPRTYPATAMQATRATISRANPQAGLVNTANNINVQQLTVSKSTSQVWNNLGPALQQAGYKVLLKDKRVNIYYILDLSATRGKVQKNTPMYQIHMSTISPRKTTLSITDNTGAPVNNKIGQRVLRDIHRNL